MNRRTSPERLSKLLGIPVSRGLEAVLKARLIAAVAREIELRGLLEGYRDGSLSRDQVGQLLGFSLWETEAFLKQRQAYLQYTEEDLARDRGDLDGAMPQ